MAHVRFGPDIQAELAKREAEQEEVQLKRHLEHLQSSGFGQDEQGKAETISANFGLLLAYHEYEMDLGRQPGPGLEIVQSFDTDLVGRTVRFEESQECGVFISLRTRRRGQYYGALGIRSVSSSGEEEQMLLIRVRAMVMDPGTGTPKLKANVRCIAVYEDPDESEAGTEWQGFGY